MVVVILMIMIMVYIQFVQKLLLNLEWLKEAGNDLITPHPEFGFPGLKDGDGWCVCASWYARAVEADKGCPIFLKRTHKNTLKHLPIETLKKFAIDLS